MCVCVCVCVRERERERERERVRVHVVTHCLACVLHATEAEKDRKIDAHLGGFRGCCPPAMAIS